MDPPPRSLFDPPTFVVPAFLPFEILGETAGAEEFYPSMRLGKNVVPPPMTQNAQRRLGISGGVQCLPSLNTFPLL